MSYIYIGNYLFYKSLQNYCIRRNHFPMFFGIEICNDESVAVKKSYCLLTPPMCLAHYI